MIRLRYNKQQNSIAVAALPCKACVLPTGRRLQPIAMTDYPKLPPRLIKTVSFFRAYAL